MGAFRDDKGALVPLNTEIEMAMVAGSDYQSEGGRSWLAFLRADRRGARELGRALEDTVRSFAAAYPGEARDHTYSNEEWRRAGYEGVAEANELLGLDRR